MDEKQKKPMMEFRIVDSIPAQQKLQLQSKPSPLIRYALTAMNQMQPGKIYSIPTYADNKKEAYRVGMRLRDHCKRKNMGFSIAIRRNIIYITRNE
jgi:hypothetical protein